MNFWLLRVINDLQSKIDRTGSASGLSEDIRSIREEANPTAGQPFVDGRKSPLLVGVDNLKERFPQLEGKINLPK